MGKPSGHGALLTCRTLQSPAGTSYLVAVDPVTGASRRLTSAAIGNVCSPAVSPDGKLIAVTKTARIQGYGAPYELHTLRRDGTGDRLVYRSPDARHYLTGTPSFGPGGTLVFSLMSYVDGTATVYSVRLDGSHLTRLDLGVSNSVRVSGTPRFSPDGKMLAFVGDDTIWVRKGTAAATRLPDYAGRHGSHFPPFTGELSWSPDSGRLLATASGDGGNDGGFIEYDLAAGGWQQLIAQPREGNGVIPYYWDPVFSPDGRKVAFLENIGSSTEAGWGSEKPGDNFIDTMDPAVPGIAARTAKIGSDYGLAWQP
ncbi:TolB family protein [Streptomyces sp. NPDC004393]|uniref:TolB family protein n=1 Tax=Streptomyces sp. NPDC004533 TaxID=3154278 RepID=UPI0033B84449